MAKYKSVVHQGWHAYKHDKAPIEACPYPDGCETAREWRTGWIKGQKDEPWGQPLRKRKIRE